MGAVAVSCVFWARDNGCFASCARRSARILVPARCASPATVTVSVGVVVASGTAVVGAPLWDCDAREG